MRRQRSAKIVATIGPASNSEEKIEALFKAGVDVFRLNFSHGKQEDHKKVCDSIRTIEQSVSAAAVDVRRGWPVRHPSPKKSEVPKMPTIASLPCLETTVILTLPFS